MKNFFFFLLTIFLIGCGGITYPNWYNNPPQDQENILYATGVGLDKKSAISAALSNLASKISTTISSNLSISQGYSTTSGVNKNIQQKISQKVNNFHFYSYKVKKIKKLDDTTYVALVCMNKNKNGKLIVDESSKKLNQIELTFNNISNPIEKLKFARKNIKELKTNIIPNLFIAKLLNQNSDKLINKAQKLLIKLQNYIQNIKISINAKEYNNVIANFLTNLNFIISNKAPIKIYVTTKGFKTKILDNYVYKIQATLKIYYKHKILYNKTIISIGKSIIDYQTSKGIAKEDLYNKIKSSLNKVF